MTSYWCFIKEGESVLVEKNGTIKGAALDIIKANNQGCIKIKFSEDVCSIYDLKSFRSEKNIYSTQFNDVTDSRSKFVEKWKVLTNEVDVISKDNRSTKNNIELKDNTSSTTVLNNECTVKEIESVEITGNKSTTRSKTVNSFSTHTFHAAEVIQEKFAGYFHVNVDKLVQPDWTSLTREPEPWHIKQLKEEFKKNPFSYFTMMVINIKGISKDQFQESMLDNDQYSLETIGGNHSRLALQGLLMENPNQSHLYNRRLVAVYCNLTADEAKRKGNDHNTIHRFGVEMNFVSRVLSFRASLYSKSGSKDKDDIFVKETPNDHSLLQEWKKGLELATGSENRETLNNRFRFEINLARLDMDTWNQLFLFFQNWVQNKIAGIPKINKSAKHREISSRNVRCLDGLSANALCNLLEKANYGEINYTKLQELCEEEKKNVRLRKKLKRKPQESNNENNNSTQDKSVDDENAVVDQTKMKKMKKSDEDFKTKFEQTKIQLDAAIGHINDLKTTEELLQSKETCYIQEIEDLKKENKYLKDELDKTKSALDDAQTQNELMEAKTLKLKMQIKNLTRENEKYKIDNKKKNSITDFTANTVSNNLTPGPSDKIELEEDKSKISTGNKNLKIGDTIIIKPYIKSNYKPGRPWLAETVKVTPMTVHFKWFSGNYDSVWDADPEFENCNPDKIARKQIVGTLKFNSKNMLSKESIDYLKNIYENLS